MFKSGYRARFRILVRPRNWRRASMRLFKWGRRATSTKDYNLVTNDDYDTRIPLHPEEAFHYGINFEAKYIGSMDVPRPSSRVEIVAAMRRVRYEFKAKDVKKRKVTVEVSTDGVRVTTSALMPITTAKPKKSRFGRNKTKTKEVEVLIMHHPIYRIFYVSHDSSDLKIFSYIARDGATNTFKCNVFKSTKRNQAMRIVRTVGQAFEVCHKLQTNASPEPVASGSSVIDEPPPSERASEARTSKEGTSVEAASESGGSERGAIAKFILEKVPGEKKPVHLDLPPPPRKENSRRSPQRPAAPMMKLPEVPDYNQPIDISTKLEDAGTPLSAQHQLLLLQERLDQQTQLSQAAVAQLIHLRDQLASEQAARCEAQARTQQLLLHNNELLDHISALVAHLQDRERGSTRPISAQYLTLLPQNPVVDFVRNGNMPSSISSPQIQLAQPGNLGNLSNHGNIRTQNIDNNNVWSSPFILPPGTPGTPSTGPNSPIPFGSMTDEQIQAYLMTKFENLGENGPDEQKMNINQQYFQNSNAFPSIPPLSNNYSSLDIASLMNHNIYGPNEASGILMDDLPPEALHSMTSSDDSSPDMSSDDSMPFIKPLSHNGTLAATSQDGRLKLIVPVSPSGNVADAAEKRKESKAPPSPSGDTLQVERGSTSKPAPILRTTSERLPQPNDLMSALRSQWARHTTK